MLYKHALLAITGTIFFTAISFQAFAGSNPPKLDSGDTAWMLTATALVLMMTIPGLGLFYSGMVQKKNVLSVLMQCFSICCLMSILWMICGYSLSFSPGNPYVGGLDNFFLNGMSVDALNGTIPDSLFMLFQMTFAIITPALIVGAFVGRMKFSATLWFSGIWMLVVYAPVTHWVWGGGFLSDDGVLDFAGGTVVHINAGVAGLVAALFVGKRDGLGTEAVAPHNLVLSVIGASLLWIGWFGFNAGSALAANGSTAMAMAVTQIASASGALTWMFVEWTQRKKPSVLGIISGAIGGLVAITPAAGFVDLPGALVIGIVSGFSCYWGATWLKRKLGYDDALDVFGIHGIGGIVGALLTGVFAKKAIGGASGLLEGNVAQLGTQAWGIVATIFWCAIASAIILKVIDLTIGIKVDKETERDGLDLKLHGETTQ